MFSETRKLRKKSQDVVASECGIDRKRYMKIENNRALPDPHELIAIDQFLKQDGKLIMNYCSCHCPAGKAIGLSYERMEPVLAGMKVMKFLSDAENTRTELEDILADGVIDEHEHSRFRVICETYDKLKNALISLGMHKEKVTCVGAQATLRSN
ncbi:helix-turn-helix domain-containing protein [Pelosinus propionicus]|uniref:Helix-turn-helix domain-containing protein n=1 Tax=Pelosinus propionicus DSM 13327 TaxID=1123291 RepID=A0A1I4P2M6_9FIRM|nr:helix-turn-helix transcriptional regulator [Pelosinus propionicus]SFM22032.1 Helix-turn-helix domain-containing protein [Pelosinus propionicus DSM 13327]